MTDVKSEELLGAGVTAKKAAAKKGSIEGSSSVSSASSVSSVEPSVERHSNVTTASGAQPPQSAVQMDAEQTTRDLTEASRKCLDDSDDSVSMTSSCASVSCKKESEKVTKVARKRAAKRKRKEERRKKKKAAAVERVRNKACFRRIQSEMKSIMLNAPIGVSATPKKGNILEWIATIKGPTDTPYEGGNFHVNVKFPEDYPFSPPKMVFKTRIYHCNVCNQTGAICLDILKDQWSPALTVSKALLSLMLLLQEPNPADPLVPHIATEYMANRTLHDKTATDWTRRYAKL